MTAVAPPLTFQPSSRLGWTSNSGSFGAMNSDEVGRMFQPAPRRTAQRQNSSSSVGSSNSTASSLSTISTSSASAQQSDTVTAGQDSGSWATRKRPGRGLWPPGKAEPATGISIARPQIVNSATNGPTASSAVSALHAPLLPSQQMANGTPQPTTMRSSSQSEPPAILHLLPINGTFERKTITIPYHPEVLRIGRQTNQKTIPTPLNGYFDSKVLSRQHAEVYADRQGRIFIRDVKSSNGTFVNGSRLSPENKESEPRELREQDVLELGIDIVSEDQKTVVHHKVAAKIEHAGVYGQGNDALSFGDLDLNGGSGPLPGPHKRNSSLGSLSGRGIVSGVPSQPSNGSNILAQPPLMRNWLNPITTEHIMKKLNAEMKLAMQQSEDLARARQSIEAILASHDDSPVREVRSGSERSKPPPVKSPSDLKSIFPEPPAPPPSAPLPEKPDVARALADPVIQPLLRRNDTVQLPSANSSPTRADHSSDILRLCEELKLAKGELNDQSDRMKSLEHELAAERTARESAEGRVQELEEAGRKDSPRDSFRTDAVAATLEGRDTTNEPPEDLLQQFHWLHSSVAEMKQQMEAFRVRVEVAEAERDEARQSLAEMIEQKRKANSERTQPRSPSRSRPANSTASSHSPGTKASHTPNGHAPPSAPSSPTSNALLERAGVEEGQPITPEQAKMLTQFLTRDVLHQQDRVQDSSRAYYGVPITSAAAVVLLGIVLMSWGNGWPKMER